MPLTENQRHFLACLALTKRRRKGTLIVLRPEGSGLCVKKQNQEEHEMKMFKKIMAVALAAVMMLAMMTACDGGTTREESAINALNQARVQYGYNELRHSEEADVYAQQSADAIAKYNSKNGSFSESALQDSLNQLRGTVAEGQTFKGMRIFWNLDSFSAENFKEESKRYIAQVEGSIVGVGSGSTQYSQFIVVVVY